MILIQKKKNGNDKTPILIVFLTHSETFRPTLLLTIFENVYLILLFKYVESNNHSDIILHVNDSSRHVRRHSDTGCKTD